MEGPVEIDIDHPPPFIEFIFIERRILAGDPGGVNQNIDPPEFGFDLGCRRRNRRIVDDIDRDR